MLLPPSDRVGRGQLTYQKTNDKQRVMTINTENSSVMVLKDNKYRPLLTACLLIVAGIFIAVLFGGRHFMPILFGLVFVAAGAAVIYFTKQVTIELDRASGRVRIRLQSLKKKEERDFAMTQIRKIVLRKTIQTAIVSSGASTRSAKTYYQFLLIFVTDQNEELPFDFGKVSAGITNLLFSPDDKKKQAAQQIADFIGAPLEVSLPSGPGIGFLRRRGDQATENAVTSALTSR